MKLDDEDLARVVAAMMAAERWQIEDLENLLSAYPEAVRGRAITMAREVCREEHEVDWGPTPGHRGLYRRLDPGQTAGQGRRYRATGTKKLLRASRIIQSASKKTGDAKERERLEREASRALEKALYRARKERDGKVPSRGREKKKKT